MNTARQVYTMRDEIEKVIGPQSWSSYKHFNESTHRTLIRSLENKYEHTNHGDGSGYFTVKSGQGGIAYQRDEDEPAEYMWWFYDHE